MSENDTLFAQRLRSWRRLVGIKQLALADILGVSQAAVSYWETGRDKPSAELMRRIDDMIAGTRIGEVALERVFTQRQPGIMALYDFDGIRFMAASRGYLAQWPGMSLLQGKSIARHLVDESGSLLANEAIRRDILSGKLALISGVSDRHTDIVVGTAVRHEWNICFRRFGPKTLLSISFEPCDETNPVGINEVKLFTDLK
ncbi:Helix-turn-helix domain-containing protein [Ancylobacter rudongensis]|uniref:Helix-turn-helix domain-containing protein n=2 Tax=Ancylobacter rudongensis TaxID=177413 RepID=A0A1G4QNQ6_9HYPH|nr:Helix-turn-helix domain-containing protein [Ancylobacter rudongensis]